MTPGHGAGRATWLAALAFALTPLLVGCGTADDGPGGTSGTGVRTPAGAVDFPAGWPLPADPGPVRGTSGMVVTTDSLATAAGLEMLRAGGNAVDAAVAVHFALAVVHPAAGNIGGGGFLVLRTRDGSVASLDFREEAPGAAEPDMYLDSEAEGESTDESWIGHLASGVPGSVAGMVAAHERYGSLPWSRLLEPAVRYAREGFVVRREFHENVSESERIPLFDPARSLFLPSGEAPEPGTVFRQPDLARSLEAIAESRGEAFYRGWIADSLVAEMERGGGIITRRDLRAYEARWRQPVVSEYRGRTVVSMPPPSSGGVTLAEILNIVEGFDLRSLGWHSADAVHVAAEAMRRAFGDRNFYLGDPDFVEMPLERLTSQAYADSLASSIRLDTVSPSSRFNRVPTESAETTHYSVVDSAGNAVAVSTTVNGFFGSGVLVRGAGFFLNNEMNDFTVDPGEPNEYGLVQGEANAVRPGKRMLSSMSPTILVDREGRTELLTGTPGGATIITTVFQMISNHVDYGLGPATSVNGPRFHHQNLPDRLYYEANGLVEGVVEALRVRGHRMEERDGYSGDVASIWIAPDGTYWGAADPRREGKAMGY